MPAQARPADDGTAMTAQGAAPGGALLLRNVRPLGAAAADFLLRDGRIAAAHVTEPDTAGAVPVLEGRGRLLLPGLVEAHTHLDKSLLGMPWYRNEVGPRLIDKIENERAARKRLPIPPRRQSARQVALSVSHGSTHIRSHVDVDTECGLSGIEGVLETRDAMRDLCTIQVVAFPQSGLLVRPGTLELLDQALDMGADVVGGLDPCSIDRDPKAHLDAVFGLAERHGKPVDIHLHEPGELGLFSMELILERTRALGMAGRVVVSHAFCLGHPDPALVDPMLDALAEAGVAIMSTGSPSRPVPPVKRLAAAGVVLCAGSDGIRDTWGPYGNADMLERATILGLRNNLRRDDELVLALDAVTTGGARAIGLDGYGLGARGRAPPGRPGAGGRGGGGGSRRPAPGGPHGHQGRPRRRGRRPRADRGGVAPLPRPRTARLARPPRHSRSGIGLTCPFVPVSMPRPGWVDAPGCRPAWGRCDACRQGRERQAARDGQAGAEEVPAHVPAAADELRGGNRAGRMRGGAEPGHAAEDASRATQERLPATADALLRHGRGRHGGGSQAGHLPAQQEAAGLPETPPHHAERHGLHQGRCREDPSPREPGELGTRGSYGHPLPTP